jgi:nucleoside-diphosphate-sugar epimerase
MRILIIGGTGFIGARVAGRLVSAGHEVAVFHRGQTEPWLAPAVARIHGDRQNLAAFRGEFARFDPQVVIDMTAYTEQDARAVMDAFRGAAERVVAVSSMDVYGAYGRLIGLDAGPAAADSLTEESPLRVLLYPYRGKAKGPSDMLYDYEKILVERTVLHDPELAGTVLRLPKVYGPGDRQPYLFDYLKRMDDGRPAILLAEGQAQWRWTRGYVENVAAAIALAATDERAVGRVYNVGEESALTEAAWVQIIGHAAGWQGHVRILPRDLVPVNLTPPFDWRHHLAADTSRIRDELGYEEPVDRLDALKETIAWKRAHPLAAIDETRFDYAAEDAALKQWSARSSPAPA